HMLNGGDTNQRLLWVGSVVGDTTTSLDTARLNGYLLSSHANIDTFRTKIITLVAIYDALRLHRAQWAHAAREHIQMNFTSIAAFDLTHPDDAKYRPQGPQKAPGNGLPHQGPTRASTATLGRLQVYTQPLRRPTRSTPAAAINRPPTIAISVLVFVPVTARFS